MVDLVRALKFENPATGGTQTDEVPTELNETEDYASARGFALQRTATQDEAVIVGRDASDALTLKDAVHTTPMPLTHMLNGIAGFEEALRSTAGRITSVTLWTSPAKTQKISECVATYTGAVISSIVKTKYDDAGVLLETLTGTVARTLGRVASVTWVKL